MKHRPVIGNLVFMVAMAVLYIWNGGWHAAYVTGGWLIVGTVINVAEMQAWNWAMRRWS